MELVMMTARVRTKELEFKSRPHHSLAMWRRVPQRLPIRVPQRYPKIEMAKHLTHSASWVIGKVVSPRTRNTLLRDRARQIVGM